MEKRTNNLIFLDSLRGFAALYVAIGHARWLLWEGFNMGFEKHPETYNLLEKMAVLFFSVFKYGHEAVLFFFVLSGFVIHLKQAKALKRKTLEFDYTDYLKRRFFRIYPPFLFAIVLTFCLDSLGKSLHFTVYAQNTLSDCMNSSLRCDLSFTNFLGNLVFWKNESIGIGTWGTNGPLWSLKYEWWFYMIYPALLIITQKIGSFKTSLCVFVIFCASIFAETQVNSFIVTVFTYLLSWWLGAVLADIYTRRIKIHVGFFMPFVLLIPLLLLNILPKNSNSLFDTYWAFGFFGFLSCLFYLQTIGHSLSFLNRYKWIGDCSYTMYVTHFPILVFINGVVLSQNGNNLPKTQVFILIAPLFCLAMAYGLHFFTEKKFVFKSKISAEKATLINN